MAFYSIAGSKFEIGAVVALKAADFVAADFTTPLTAASEVKEPETIGTMADPWDTEEFTNVTDGRTRVAKAIRKGATFDLVCAYDPTDAGQLAMRAAADARDNYAFRMTYNDKPATGAAPKNSTRLWVGLVLNVEDDPSGKIGKVKFTIQPNSNILRTYASPT